MGAIMSKRTSNHDDDDPVDQHVVYEKMFSEYERDKLQLLEEKADNGNVDAMVKVARIYSYFKVYDEALRYYEMAASQGNLVALDKRAEFYFNGWGVSQDVNKGLQYLEQAADRGSEYAMRRLADIYLNGENGVTRDDDKARRYKQKLANVGEDRVQYYLALHHQGRDDFGYKIPEAKVDEIKAFDLFEKGAQQNYIDSMYELGRCYRDRRGTSRDPDKAKEWFLKAFAKRHDRSLFGLAVMVAEKAITDTEKQTIDGLLMKQRYLGYVRKEWFKWYSNKKVITAEQEQGDANTSLLDDLDLYDATFLLARLLALTLDQDKLQIANKLIGNVKDQLDTHELLAWLGVLVEDLYKENEELLRVKQSADEPFNMHRILRPIALIGQGQFGKVYLAWCSYWGKYLAIKFVEMNLVYKDRVLARNVVREQFTCRVLKEKNVKNTVKYLGYIDVLECRKRGLIFELCTDLTEVEQLAEEARQRIDWDTLIDLEGLPDWTEKVPSNLCSCVVFHKDSKWTTVQVIKMLRQAAEALLEVHKLGFIHHDITPRNILCDGKGKIQLAGFGWAKFKGSGHDDASLLKYYGKAFFNDKHQYASAWWAPECFGSEDDEGLEAIFFMAVRCLCIWCHNVAVLFR